MKQFLITIVALTGSLFIGSCQEKFEWTIDIQAGVSEPADETNVQLPSFEVLMTLGGNLSPWPQGGDCWGDYFFQFVNNNTVVRVYDLSLKSLVQTVTIGGSQRGFVPNCHCNTVCFGTEYYDPEDIFPLIYVSTGYASAGYTGALVYRIVQHNGIFYITHVQTIKFPIEHQSSWTEFVPGDEGFAYLCYTSERVIFKVMMPTLKDGDIVISRADALESFQFPPQPDWMSASLNQDRIFYHGKILLVSSEPQSGSPSEFVVLNLEKRERETIIEFTKIGLTQESESIFVWQGDIYVAFTDKIVKLVNFIDTP